MIQKDGTLVIKDWQKGIGESPLTGFGDMRNVDIHNPKGALKIAPAPTKISSTTVTGLVTWFATQPSSTPVFYAGERLDNQVYSITNLSVVADLSHPTAGDLGAGTWWKDNLIMTRVSGGTVYWDAYTVAGGWDTAFATLGSGDTTGHIMPIFVHVNDDTVYAGAENSIVSLQEKAGQNFDSTSGATYTSNASALDLPEDYKVESLAQLGLKLAIGASIATGANPGVNRYFGKILPWDRVANSFSAIDTVDLEAGGVRQMLNVNNVLHFTNGEQGKYYVSNLSNTETLPEIAPLAGVARGNLGELYDAKALFNGEALFGVSSDNTNFAPAGVYGLKDGAWRFLQISTGEVGENDRVRIGAIHTKNENNFFVSWEDTQTGAFGIDEFGKSDYRYTGYLARVDSQLYQVGTSNNKKSYRMIEAVLNEPLATGQGVRFSYRKDTNSAFTVIDTIDFATHGATLGEAVGATIQDAQQVQIRIELTTGASSTTTPSLKEVRLW